MKIEDFAKQFIGVKQGSNKHKQIVNGYNGVKPLPRSYRVKYNDSWCATFVSYVALMCGVKNFPYECSCYYMTQQAKKNKQVVKVPKVGYLVMYDWKNDGTINHVGIITKIDGDNLTVIEGNYSKQVKTRVINRKNVEIECFIKIEYDTPITEEKPVKTDLTKVANDVIKGKYGNGVERKTKLESLGYDYKEVQKVVNKLLKNN